MHAEGGVCHTRSEDRPTFIHAARKYHRDHRRLHAAQCPRASRPPPSRSTVLKLTQRSQPRPSRNAEHPARATTTATGFTQRTAASERYDCRRCHAVQLDRASDGEASESPHDAETAKIYKTHRALGEWAAAEFSLPVALPRTTVLGILKRPPNPALNSSRKANHSVRCPQLGATVAAWVSKCEDFKTPIVTQATIRGKVEQLRDVMLNDTALPERMPPSARSALSEMTFSGGWLEKFQRRHQLVSRTTHGEAASVRSNAVEKGRLSLQTVTSAFAKCDVFNMDETAFFYCMAPTTSLSKTQFAGRKKVKKRLTVAVANNADGSMKLPLLFVGTAAKPRCFGGKSGAEHGLDYCSSPKGWMTTKLFGDWVKRFDERMRKDGRRVLLLLDNVSSHRVEEALTNVVVHMLSPNTTSHLQPQDAGIIQAFKKEINKVKRRYAVDKFDKLIEADGADKEKMEAEIDSLFVADVLTAMKWAEEAWSTVTTTTVTNCWRHTGVFDEDLYELVTGIEKLHVGPPTVSPLV